MSNTSELVKQIESYVDSSTSPTQQASNVTAIASLLKKDVITLAFLVKEMELYLTTTDHVLRARGILLLGDVLVHLQLKPLDNPIVHTLAEFFTEKLTDWRALRGALIGCLALVRRKTNAGVVTGTDAKAMVKSYLENIQVQSLGHQDRKLCFQLLECLLNWYPEEVTDLGDHLVYGICEAMEGEKDPQCLIYAFRIVEALARMFPDPDGPVASIAEDLFNILGRYFPIHYTHPKSDDIDVSREDLARALMLAFSASPFFEPLAIPLLLEKLSSTLPLAKVDSLKYLSYCVAKYGPERIAKHAQALWNSLKAVIYNFPEGHASSLPLDMSNGSQGNEVRDEALGLLQKLVSQQSNDFLNLILEDEVMISFINSTVSTDSTSCNEQKLYAVGDVLCVSAKASLASCNRVFETVFLRLLPSIGVPSSVLLESGQDANANIPYGIPNFGNLYLCIEILGACRDLATKSVQYTSNHTFVDDSWCQMLGAISGSLTDALASHLVKSTNDIHLDADISVRVKGLRILATFPGGNYPVSKLVFDKILVTLVSHLMENHNMAALWKMSVDALVKIGEFLKEYHDSEKLQSYLSNVIEHIILLITLDDTTIPYSLILEAASDIGASCFTFMSRIVQRLQDAVIAKFLTFHVDGDLRSVTDLVQLLDCYSNKLLPWLYKVGGSQALPLSFALSIWDQIEAVMKITSCIVEKPTLAQELLNATTVALKLAVAVCSEEDQQQIVEKASDVMLSDKAFSLNFVPSRLEELQIMQDSVSLTCRDEWLFSMFASVVIALRPRTQILKFRSIINLLLMAFVKGHVASAQALGSIVNKMPVEGIQLQHSSHFSLDDLLELIIRTTLGSCGNSVLSENAETSDHIEIWLKPTEGDCKLLQVHCLTGISWIGKGLLMRGHDKTKDITVIFLKILTSSSKIKVKELTLPERTEERCAFLSLVKSAADAFHVLMSDSEDCLNKTFHATLRPLYKQRLFSTIMPIMLSAVPKSESPAMRFMLYRAIGHVISNTPLIAVLSEAKKLLPVLLDVISVLSEDPLNKDLIYSLLLVLSSLLMDKNGHDTAVENAHVMVNCLTKLLSPTQKMLVRETAIQCLVAMSGMPHTRIYPLRPQVIRAISEVLDDPKRAVRQEAVRCRHAWASIV